jgi:GDP/UDP-N,N'-diacetylbacillosamine 2-epimerase (hydrolysing)
MKVSILTSSRADFGIYETLIDELILEDTIEIEIIAFGTHLSKFHGYTLNNIKNKYKVKVHQISSLIVNDNEVSIASAYGLTLLKFADFWNVNKYDLVFCLGDRYEMSAAVQASIPFGVKLAHIHGGETTLGATDNIYRHQISLASNFHFTSTSKFKSRVADLIETDQNIFNVGSLSISNIKNFIPLLKEEFLLKFKIENKPYCLITFHPETNAFEENKVFAIEMKKALLELSNQINLVITMPNADTMGSVYREQLVLLKEEKSEKIFLIENFGKENYFSAMYYSNFLLGNTSSGIIEAASFNKYVVNVGKRQEGRAQSKNIVNAAFNNIDILNAIDTCLKLGEFKGGNIYYKEHTAKSIVKIIKKEI